MKEADWIAMARPLLEAAAMQLEDSARQMKDRGYRDIANKRGHLAATIQRLLTSQAEPTIALDAVEKACKQMEEAYGILRQVRNEKIGSCLCGSDWVQECAYHARLREESDNDAE